MFNILASTPADGLYNKIGGKAGTVYMSSLLYIMHKRRRPYCFASCVIHVANCLIIGCQFRPQASWLCYCNGSLVLLRLECIKMDCIKMDCRHWIWIQSQSVSIHTQRSFQSINWCLVESPKDQLLLFSWHKKRTEPGGLGHTQLCYFSVHCNRY